MATCFRCKQSISGNVIRAVNKDWHPECFVCYGCGGPIQAARFSLFSGRPYHADCFLCEGCGKPIGNKRFLLGENKPYHEACYHRKFTPGCSVCDKPLIGKFSIDIWGNRFCIKHNKKLVPCTSCQRLISDGLTRGGKKYKDGTPICNLCLPHAVTSQAEALKIFDETRKGFEALGFRFKGAETPFRLVDAKEIKRFKKVKRNKPILGMARNQVTTQGKKVVRRDFQEIIVLAGLPRLHFETVCVHELCHAWLFFNGFYGLPQKTEEGLCTLSEFLWLKQFDSDEAKVRRRMINENQDPIYGNGFREAAKALEKRDLAQVLTYVRKNGRFPGTGLLGRLFG